MFYIPDLPKLSVYVVSFFMFDLFVGHFWLQILEFMVPSFLFLGACRAVGLDGSRVLPSQCDGQSNFGPRNIGSMHGVFTYI